ncbi:GAF domain-containing protein [Pseudonocardia sp. Ae263_Ps1]|uniref:GAF domain-containing protein n=1 Tax=Pseudonocardia sp. Ae263_Ps1 TaxID=1885030 RepID=UPI001C37B3BF|nr:GAF domain-containing protein [Pseudonocardia sp. Ae263_Ps1]
MGGRPVVDLGRLSRDLAAASEVAGPDAPMAVCEACVSWLPMTGAAVTVMTGQEQQELVCATDPVAARIDELQFAFGDGPCLTAFRTGRAVLVSDTTDPSDRRWPLFTAAAVETGARAMFVFPLQIGAARVGVLDCYRTEAGPLSSAELAGALRAADVAVWTLIDRMDWAGPAADDLPGGPPGSGTPVLGGGLAAAAPPRAEVHQATGMLVAQARVSAPVALARLRAAAFATELSLGQVAAEVVARRLRLTPDGAWQPDLTRVARGVEEGPPWPESHQHGRPGNGRGR